MNCVAKVELGGLEPKASVSPIDCSGQSERLWVFSSKVAGYHGSNSGQNETHAVFRVAAGVVSREQTRPTLAALARSVSHLAFRGHAAANAGGRGGSLLRALPRTLSDGGRISG